MSAQIWIALCLLGAASPITFDLSNMAVTDFPETITWKVTNLTLDHNLIRVVDVIKPYPNLSVFSMYDNLLLDFPDFTNISTTLTYLSLGQNWIRQIPADLLDMLTSLEFLDVSENRLTSIPDVPGPGSTLTALSVAGNMLSGFPVLARLGSRLESLDADNISVAVLDRGHLLQLPALRNLDLSMNKLTSFPNLSLLPANRPFPMALGGNPFVCDRKMAYLKLAEMQGLLTLVDNLFCEKPPNLANIAWIDILPGDLQDSEADLSVESNSCQVADVSSVTFSNLVGLVTGRTSSLLRCALLCVRHALCLTYAFDEQTMSCTLMAADMNGSLTDNLPTDADVFMFC